jgi:hypothetical protein
MTNVIKSQANPTPAPCICDTINPKEEHMSKFMVNLTAINTVDRQRRTAPINVMVDPTGQRFVATIPTV